MTQPWRPETGISREMYNRWVESFHAQNSRGSIAHPSVTLPSVLSDIRGTPNLPFPMPSQAPRPGLGNRIGTFLDSLPQAPRPEGLQRVATGIADWVTGNKWDFDQRGGSGQYDPQDRILTEEQWGNIPGPEDRIMDGPAPGSVKSDPTFTGQGWLDKVTGKEVTNPDGTPLTPPMQTPPADVPTPPLEKTLEQRVWERDQQKRVPDKWGRLYPDKNDPDFLDPRITKEGFKTMQYIPELDDPNWTPWGGRSTLSDRLSPLGGGEGIQYRL